MVDTISDFSPTTLFLYTKVLSCLTYTDIYKRMKTKYKHGDEPSCI